MTIKQQLLQLIKAQDMIREVYVQYSRNKIEQKLKQLDKEMSLTINMIGKQ